MAREEAAATGGEDEGRRFLPGSAAPPRPRERCDRCGSGIDPTRRFCGSCGGTIDFDRPLDPLAADPAPRPELPERFEVLDFLGAGAMGRVYLCRDRSLSVNVAVKVLRREVSESESALRGLRNEASCAARLRQCPGILVLYEFDNRGGTAYLVMEYAPGGTLAARLRNERRLPEEECRRVGASVARALASAHELGVVHRDIKPSNIFFDGADEAKIGDFGIAKIVADISTAHAIDPAAGTPAYMAPEVIRGGAADGRADLYSLGCMLYEMATGQLPHKGSFPEILARKCDPGAEPPDPRKARPTLSPSFASIVRKLLRTDPAERYATGRSCAQALETVDPAADETETLIEHDLRRARSRLREAVACQERRMFDEAKTHLVEAYRIHKARGLLRDPALAPVLKFLARNYAFQGRYDRALSTFRAALELRREAVGPDHPEIAAELRYLGQLLRLQGDYEAAGRAYSEAFKIVRASFGPRDASLVRILEHIATCHLRCGRAGKARDALKKALEVAEESRDVSRGAMARIQNSLASLALEAGEFEKCEKWIARSLDLLEKRYGGRHLAVAEALELQAVLFDRRGRKEEAAESFARAQKVRAARSGRGAGEPPAI